MDLMPWRKLWNKASGNYRLDNELSLLMLLLTGGLHGTVMGSYQCKYCKW